MGNDASHLTADQQQEVATKTPFKTKELTKLLKRYSSYDNSDRGINGIDYETCVAMPEFAGNRFVPYIVKYHMDKNSQKIYPKQFIFICGVLSSETSSQTKKDFLFDIFDTGQLGVMTHGEVFSLYKILFGSAVTDHILLDLTFRALNHPDLSKFGEIRRDEFMKMIPDNEINSKLSVDLLLL